MPHWPRRDALDAPQPSRPLQLTPVVSQSPLAHSRDFALSHSLPGSSSTLKPRRDALGVLNALIALQIVPERSSSLW